MKIMIESQSSREKVVKAGQTNCQSVDTRSVGVCRISCMRVVAIGRYDVLLGVVVDEAEVGVEGEVKKDTASK